MALTGDGDLPFHESDVLLANGQPQSRPAVLAGGGGIFLGEGIEDLALVLRLDADTGIPHLDLQGRIPSFLFLTGFEHHLAAAFGELNRIGKQVVNDMLHFQFVEIHNQAL